MSSCKSLERRGSMPSSNNDLQVTSGKKTNKNPPVIIVNSLTVVDSTSRRTRRKGSGSECIISQKRFRITDSLSIVSDVESPVKRKMDVPKTMAKRKKVNSRNEPVMVDFLSTGDKSINVVFQSGFRIKDTDVYNNLPKRKHPPQLRKDQSGSKKTTLSKIKTMKYSRIVKKCCSYSKNGTRRSAMYAEERVSSAASTSGAETPKRSDFIASPGELHFLQELDSYPICDELWQGPKIPYASYHLERFDFPSSVNSANDLTDESSDMPGSDSSSVPTDDSSEFSSSDTSSVPSAESSEMLRSGILCVPNDESSESLTSDTSSSGTSSGLIGSGRFGKSLDVLSNATRRLLQVRSLLDLDTYTYPVVDARLNKRKRPYRLIKFECPSSPVHYANTLPEENLELSMSHMSISCSYKRLRSFFDLYTYPVINACLRGFNRPYSLEKIDTPPSDEEEEVNDQTGSPCMTESGIFAVRPSCSLSESDSWRVVHDLLNGRFDPCGQESFESMHFEYSMDYRNCADGTSDGNDLEYVPTLTSGESGSSLTTNSSVSSTWKSLFVSVDKFTAAPTVK